MQWLVYDNNNRPHEVTAVNFRTTGDFILFAVDGLTAAFYKPTSVTPILEDKEEIIVPADETITPSGTGWPEDKTQGKEEADTKLPCVVE
jgi:hypothetical protein